jgi:hypothetical protein
LFNGDPAERSGQSQRAPIDDQKPRARSTFRNDNGGMIPI